MTGSDYSLVLVCKCNNLGCLSLLGAYRVMEGSQGELSPKTEEEFDDESKDRTLARGKCREMVSNTKQNTKPTNQQTKVNLEPGGWLGGKERLLLQFGLTLHKPNVISEEGLLEELRPPHWLVAMSVGHFFIADG